MTRATRSNFARSRPGRRRRRRAGRRSGIALILTLLVLAILVVLTVQLAFSVKVEERIVANTEDDAAFELAGARGGPLFLAALFRDDRKNGAPTGPVDTLADIVFDPRCEEARQLQVGDASVTLEVEDLERRIPLAWLADQQKGPIVEVWLTRLITKLAPAPGDAAEVAKQIADRVRQIEGVDAPAPAAPGAPPPPAPAAPAPGEPARPRRFVSLTQLLDAGASAGAGDGSAPAPSPDAPAPAGGGIDRKFLYGDPEADPPTQGIAGFVTTWPIGAININTASPEVLFAILPEKNKGDEALWEEADAIVEGIQKTRIDPDYQQKTGGAGTDTEAPPPAGSEAPAAGGQQGASRQWKGTAFAKVDELAKTEIHAKLAQLFKKAEGGGGGGGFGGGGTPPAGGGTPPPAGGTPAGGAAATESELKPLLGVESRFYAVRVKVRRGGSGAPGAAAPAPPVDDGEGAPEEPEGVYRLVIVRDAQDVVTVLQVVEGRSQ